MAAWGTPAALEKRERRAGENGEGVHAELGGARIGSIHAGARLAGLVATRFEIDLILFGRHHVVGRDPITRVSRYGALVSASLLIEHKARVNASDDRVFWTLERHHRPASPKRQILRTGRHSDTPAGIHPI
ncbi:MAG: hypothetical protein JRG94_09430 [Deltaproteobacteria bacterium]|nr:hypothetical protein [Deltaproteobacteria bacterium]